MSQYRINSICQRTINIINCAQEGASLISKHGAVKKKIRIKKHQGHRNKMDSEYLESCLNFCSRKWLRPRRSLVKYLIPLPLWQLKTLFGDGLINFNKFFLKTLWLVALRRLRSYMFHLITVDGKKIFLKKLRLVWNGVILSVFLVL